MNDFTRRAHEAAALIADGPPSEQLVFKIVACELHGRGVAGADAVRRATATVRDAHPAFQPRHDPRLLDLPTPEGDTTLIPDHIEREILLDTSLDAVWQALTDPVEIATWFCDAAEIDLRPGGDGTFTWVDRATSGPATVRLRVETLEPPHSLSFRWVHREGAEPRPDNSLLVRVTLTPVNASTRLRLVETGLHTVDWPDDQKAAYAEDHERGWDTHLLDLRDHVVRHARSAPVGT